MESAKKLVFPNNKNIEHLYLYLTHLTIKKKIILKPAKTMLLSLFECFKHLTAFNP